MLSQVCILCGLRDEFVRQLFFKCEFADKVWQRCDKWSGITNVWHNNVESHFCQFYMPGLSNHKVIICKCI